MKATYEFSFDHGKKRLLYTLSGDVSYNDLIEISEALYRKPEYSPDLDCILDLSGSNLLMGFDDMSNFVEWLGAREKRLRGRLAIIANSPATYGTSRMYAGLGDKLQGEIKYFESIGHAEKWLDDLKQGPSA